MAETNSSAFEVLLLDEFASRLKVGRSTIFDWKKKGILKAGQHYIKQGRVLRFFWVKDALMDLNESTTQPSQSEKEPQSNQDPPKDKPHHRKVGINLDY